MRKIEFLGFPRALSMSLASLFGGTSVLLVMQFGFSVDQNLFTYGVRSSWCYFPILRDGEKK